MTHLTAVQVNQPPCALLIASPGPVWRLSQAHFRRTLGRRWMRNMVRARAKGMLHDVRHVTFDPSETSARLAMDGLNRPVLIVGTAFLIKMLASGPDGMSGRDVFATLGSVLDQREDVDAAAANLTPHLTIEPIG
jgi:hypothetical protein